MTRLRQRLARVEAAFLPPLAVPAPLPAAGVCDLAGELAAAFAAEVIALRDQLGLPVEQATAFAAESFPAQADRALNAPPDQINWFALQALCRRDPAQALQRWGEVMAAAREEVRSGSRAARAVAESASTCWQKARSLAVRAELMEAWAPRDAQEQHLIDQLAQWQALLWDWQETMKAYAVHAKAGCWRPAPQPGPHELPRLSDAEAFEHSMAMVERVHCLYLRTLKALQDGRRRPAVVVRRAGQVNIAQQQINVNG